MIVFDIETMPASPEVLEKFKPAPLLAPGDFDPASVKYGNLKDEAKRQAKLEEAMARHHQSIQAWADANSKREREFVERTTLDACTCEVAAIGYWIDGSGIRLDMQGAGPGDLDGLTEIDLLNAFWTLAAQGESMVGFNCNGFDVPMLYRRSLIRGIKLPQINNIGRYGFRNWMDSHFVDLMDIWACGGNDRIKLNSLAMVLDCGAKPDGIDGSMFHELLRTDRQKAVDYLQNDIEMTRAVAEKLGVF